tara:strand:- start:6512 stop:6940 length:429 start_codon:yes stop_codon:yes gene_type:complete
MYEYACNVERVIDGDSLILSIQLGFSISYRSSVRLFAIDTPESRTRDLDEKARGKLAKEFLEDTINSGKDIVIKTELKDSRGKFGRVLGTLYVDGLNVNQALVDNYLAVNYYGQSKKEIEKEHLENREKLIQLKIFNPKVIL